MKFANGANSQQMDTTSIHGIGAWLSAKPLVSEVCIVNKIVNSTLGSSNFYHMYTLETYLKVIAVPQALLDSTVDPLVRKATIWTRSGSPFWAPCWPQIQKKSPGASKSRARQALLDSTVDPVVKKLPFGDDPGVHLEPHGDPKCRKNHQGPQKKAPGKQGNEESTSELSAKGPTWLPPHKYHMFWRVHPCAFEWFWGHFRVPSGVNLCLVGRCGSFLSRQMVPWNPYLFRGAFQTAQNGSVTGMGESRLHEAHAPGSLNICRYWCIIPKFISW